MKRAILAALLVVAVIAAALIVNALGLFRKAPPEWPKLPASAAQSAPLSPSAKPLSPAQAAGLLRSWTCPAAKDTTAGFVLPHTPLDRDANHWKKYVRRLVASGSPAKVRRFYAVKDGAPPNAGAGFSGVPIPRDVNAYGNAIQDAETPRPPVGMGNGAFTRSTNDYVMRAIVSNKVGVRDTQVILLLIPLAQASSPQPPLLPAQAVASRSSS
ncbi:MAG TPA: hypothetical protein VFW40_12315 [Capsulimonadaceae bacterium]|nr:hypothetical protein [Capsulimonadaceae bacterium]